MRKKLLVGALSLLGLILLVAIGVFFYIRSGRLDLFLQRQIVAGLEQVGIRAEIGSTRLDIRGYKVTLGDIKLFAQADNRQVGVVESLEADFSVADYLKQQINITSVKVTRPQLFVEIDEQGRSNLDSLHAAPESTEKKATITFLTALVTIERAELNYTDRSRNITAQLPEVNATFNPKEPAALEDKINHELKASFDKAWAIYEGRRIDNISSELQADVTAENAKLYNLILDSSLGRTTANGDILAFRPLKYDLKAKTDVKLAEVARVFQPDLRIDGEATLDAQIKGTDAQYNISGNVLSGRLDAEGFRVTNIRVNTDVTGNGAEYNATADLSSGAISGPGLSISSVRLSDASLKGTGADFDVTGGLRLDALKSGKLSVGNLRGRFFADNQRVSLSQFSAVALGGAVSGDASVAYGGGQSRVDVQFKSVDLNQAATLASAKEVTVRGTANGSARLAFPGMNYRAATGRIDATFDAAISPPTEGAESAPATGQVSVIATGRGFNIEKAVVRSASSEVTATGTVDWNANGSLQVNFQSQDMAEVQRVVEAFNLVPEEVKEQYAVQLSGPGSFVGSVQGRLSSPSVQGHARLENIETQGSPFGSFEGNVAYNSSAVRVEDASLVRPDGSRADFTVNAPLVGDNNISVKANVQSFDLGAIAQFASPSLAKMVGKGAITGTVDLRGLPGPRTIEGTADLTLTSAEFNIPSLEEGKEDTKLSVPEFIGKVTIANSVLSVQDLRLQTGGSTIVGQGTFNLDTYAYDVKAEGKDIDLGQMADAVKSNVQLSGVASLNVTGQGIWKDWKTIDINTTIQGQNVRVNGRDLGDAKLVAFTEGGLLKIEATGTVLEQERTLAASIDLRDPKNYPVSANVEFTDTELGPYLGLIDPQLSKLTGRATGTVRLGGALLDENGDFSGDRIEAVARLTKLELGSTIAEGREYTIRNQGDIVVTASPKGVSLNAVTFTGEGTSVTLGGTIARGGGPPSSLTINGDVNLRLLSTFTSSFFTTGLARIEASLVGSLESPQLQGFVNLKDVGLRVVDFPLSIARGNGQIRFTADQALIENFTAATPGGGTIRLEGGAALAGLVPDRFRIDIAADQVGIEFPRDTRTVLDAALNFQGNKSVQVLTGNVHVRRSAYTRDIRIEELLTGGPFGDDFLALGPGGGGGGGVTGPRINLDIRVEADNTLTIQNNLADAVASAFLNIRGPASEPIVSGRIQLARGTLEFRNERHEITRGIITLPGRRGADPVLDIQSEAEIHGYRITTSFSGALSNLETTLRSDPELPEADIISLVLTGNLAGDISTAAAATQTGLGLAQSLLSASLSERLEQGTQRLFGISRFSIDPLIVGRGSDPTARITVGQRIAKNLTVTYSQNLTSGPSGIDRIVLVEYRLSNRFSVVGFRNERGELGFDVRVRKRF
ncbi:MAG TPA: translocation/assembly module TamB domain-containing protein [Blastocatellia bacterium]|nr:translocation/assembly module TamB domain-containing protein [Blastocatellia bacterium]